MTHFSERNVAVVVLIMLDFDYEQKHLQRLSEEGSIMMNISMIFHHGMNIGLELTTAWMGIE